MNNEIVVFWFRRDLRLDDNHALFMALNSGKKVLPVFIFDENILKQLEDKSDKRLSFIYKNLLKINKRLEKFTSQIQFFYGTPISVFSNLIEKYNIKGVFSNEDYEPYAIQRDDKIKSFLQSKNITFNSFKDHVIFHKNEITKSDGKPYTVYTPYSKKWLMKLNDLEIKNYKSEEYLNQLLSYKPESFNFEQTGFKYIIYEYPSKEFDAEIIRSYDQNRDFPYEIGTSQLGIHLRFGTISIRKLVKKSINLNLVYLKELIWREFFMQILYHFPNNTHRAFKSKYDNIIWRNNMSDFKKWCNGKTGFPLVDAGMRELNSTGFMHNRVRMLTAGFLVKDLLIDWRWGEAYFAQKLLDFELASNNGNWQWAAGTGCDAAPYFRVFNPETQQKKFDPNFLYIKKWLPEFGTDKYPKEMLNHKEARLRALEVYKKAVSL